MIWLVLGEVGSKGPLWHYAVQLHVLQQSYLDSDNLSLCKANNYNFILSFFALTIEQLKELKWEFCFFHTTSWFHFLLFS